MCAAPVYGRPVQSGMQFAPHDGDGSGEDGEDDKAPDRAVGGSLPEPQ